MSDAQPVCVITGGSSGIGLETAKKFAASGYRIAICGRNEQRLAEAESILAETCERESDVLTLALDVGAIEEAQRFVQSAESKHGQIDVLVNNAGIAPMSAIGEFDDSAFHDAMRVHTHAVFATTRAAWPMLSRQGGTIINISSMAAVDPFPGFSVYGACKAWVELFTKAMAAEGAPANIRTFAIRIGAVETPLLRSLFPDYPEDQTLSVTEVATMIYRLATEACEFQSGDSIPMSK